MPPSARRNLAAAGITGRIGKFLFDAEFASEDNFTAPCQAELYVAVTRESRQAGRLRGGTAPPGSQPGWQAWIRIRPTSISGRQIPGIEAAEHLGPPGWRHRVRS